MIFVLGRQDPNLRRPGPSWAPGAVGRIGEVDDRGSFIELEAAAQPDFDVQLEYQLIAGYERP